jgi:hypothetical protein
MNTELNISEEISNSCVETATTRILLTYRDPNHEQLGRRFCDLIAERSDWKCHTDITEWKFEMLDCAGMNDMAATEALDARLIVIATSCGEELPGSLRSWVESWCSQRTESGTLVVILSECPGYSEAHWTDYAFLETQTHKCGMQLAVYATGLSPEDGSSLCLREAQRVTQAGFASVEDFSASALFV